MQPPRSPQQRLRSWERSALLGTLDGRVLSASAVRRRPAVGRMVSVEAAVVTMWVGLTVDDIVEQPTGTYRTDPAMSARLSTTTGTGNWRLPVTGLTPGVSYRMGCYIRHDAASTPATSNAEFKPYSLLTPVATVDPIPLATWALAEVTFTAPAGGAEELFWQLAIGPPSTWAVWVADWYCVPA